MKFCYRNVWSDFVELYSIAFRFLICNCVCSEMGAHFSPCGRFLAACVACMHPHMEADPGIQTLVHQEPGLPTSPTRHPISAHQVMYELRIYSLEEATYDSSLQQLLLVFNYSSQMHSSPSTSLKFMYIHFF